MQNQKTRYQGRGRESRRLHSNEQKEEKQTCHVMTILSFVVVVFGWFRRSFPPCFVAVWVLWVVRACSPPRALSRRRIHTFTTFSSCCVLHSNPISHLPSYPFPAPNLFLLYSFMVYGIYTPYHANLIYRPPLHPPAHTHPLPPIHPQTKARTTGGRGVWVQLKEADLLRDLLPALGAGHQVRGALLVMLVVGGCGWDESVN